MPLKRLLLLVLLALAVAPASADAANIAFPVGTGDMPQLAVDGSGTAFVVWNRKTGGLTNVVDFCKVPRGQQRCSASLELTADQESFSPPHVFLTGPSTVKIISTRCCYTGPNQTMMFTSTDGGASFGAPQLIGSLDASGDAILGPGNVAYVVTDTVTGATNEQALALDGGAPTTSIAKLTDDEYGGTVGLFNNNPVVAFWDFDSTTPNHVDFAAYKGSGSPNDPANWTPSAPVGPGSSTRIASGPHGLFLMYQNGSPGQEHYYVRKYDGTSFGAPVDISGQETGYVNDFFEDGSGRLHALWRMNPGFVRYTTSTDGAHWSAVTTLDDQGTLGGPFSLQEALAPDSQGFGVFDQNTGEGTIKVFPIAPNEEHTATVGTDVITLQTPGGCVAPGTITAILSVRSKKPKGHVVVKVGRVDFSVDGKLRKTVTHAPFRAVIKITGLKAGSKHKIRARAQIRVHHGPKRFKSIVNGFTICG
jgi:hypothetical protein